MEQKKKNLLRIRNVTNHSSFPPANSLQSEDDIDLYRNITST